MHAIKADQFEKTNPTAYHNWEIHSCWNANRAMSRRELLEQYVFERSA